METSWALQMGASEPVAGPSTAPSMPQAHGVTTNHGDFNLAGRDVNVNVHNSYHSYPDNVNITAILGAIRNLRIIQSANLSKATPGTGVWFFKTKMFLMWLDPNGNLKILWGTGIPGAGKTVLASIVVEELEARAKAADVQICVCYVYIRYSDRASLTVRNMLEILVKQTVERHPECALLAEAAYAQHIREKTQPSETELLELLRRFTQSTAATFYLLDALDEAPDRIQVDLVQKLASLNVRLFITSRPLEAVQARVPTAHYFSIIAQEGDLDLHITQEIARSRDLATLLEKAGSPLRDEIVSLIKSKCGGMFLHASLQLDALCECINARDVKRTLESFPSRIEDVYLQTWERILAQKPHHVLTAKTLLLWVLNTTRPMSIEALERAVAITPDSYKFEPDLLVPGVTLLALCHGLVTLEGNRRLVHLVHYTARDTLRRLLRDSFSHPSSHLSMVCMNYLMQCGFQDTAIRSLNEFMAVRRADPLLAYASDNWATHARQSLDHEETQRRIASFVSESNTFPAFTSPNGLWSFGILSPIHILALYDLPMSLLTPDNIGNPNVVTQLDGRSPLGLASVNGNEAAVASLLAHPKIQINLVSYGWSALLGATENRQEGVVKLLLAHPEIEVNSVASGRSALVGAILHGSEAVLKLLLAHPDIQVNLMSSDWGPALVRASCQQNEGISKLLLAHSETLVNLVDRSGYSALMKASEYGNQGVVKLLLARPEVEVNIVDRFGFSALLIAACKGYQGVVGLLLAHSETLVNLVDCRGYSALMKVSEYGNEGVVKLLLARPEVKVNLVDWFRSSALLIAACKGYQGVVGLLLAHSETLVNLVDSSGYSALMKASQYGNEGVVELLLARPEVEVNLVDRFGSSALLIAICRGHQGTVKLLLAHSEIQVTQEGWRGLMKAARHGHEGIARLLLACAEVNVNLGNNRRWSALMMAARYGHEGVVALLLERPEAKVNEVDNEGWSPLMKASRHGHKAIVGLLLSVPRIKTATKNKDGHTAISLALAKGHAEIVQLFREFELRQSELDPTGLTSNPGHSSSEEYDGEEVDSGRCSEDYQSSDSERWSVGDDMMDVDAGGADDQDSDADAEGEDDGYTQDEPPTSMRDAKRARDGLEDGVQGYVDDILASAPKRRRGEAAAQGP